MITPIRIIIFCLCITGINVLWWFNTQPVKQELSQPTMPLTIPLRHLGIIMDGNRRWARQHGYKPWIGHKKGIEPVKTAVEFCIKNNIPFLTLYVFSLENFNRPQEELSYLFDILAQQISDQELEDVFSKGVKISFIGDQELFPEKIKPLIEKVENKTRNGDKLHVQLLFCYGGQQEITAACKKIAADYAQGKIKDDEITPEFIKKQLWTHQTPAPDLIVRTAGDQRLSNFLTWDAAYAELAFLPCFWPEITADMLTKTVQEFYGRKRTFGR